MMKMIPANQIKCFKGQDEDGNHHINECVKQYQNQLKEGFIQVAYLALTKYVAQLKVLFPKEYDTGNISFGYLDFTYFPFFNAYLREHMLRFGIVLNHKEMRFELWLMGRNASVQQEYWDRLKDTIWNKEVNTMPKYSCLEVCLLDSIDFNQKEAMSLIVVEKAIALCKEIQLYLESISSIKINKESAV